MRRLLLVALAVMVSGFGLLATVAPAPLAPRPAAATAPAPIPTFDGRARPTPVNAGAPEELARPRCFADLLAVDAALDFEGIRLAFARGLGRDQMAAEYLGERIGELIGASPERALEVMAWAKDADAEDAVVLLGGLATSAGAKDPRVAQGLLAIGESGIDESVRVAAIDALRTQPRLDDDGRRRLKGLALGATSDDLAWRATRALGSVMNEHLHAASTSGASLPGEGFVPYWDELMDIAQTSADPAVRAMALEAPLYSDPILPAAKIAVLTELMLDEPQRDVRELAAFQLGLTESPREALEAFRRVFEQEYDECVRWACARFAVRAGGMDSLPLLEHFARIDPAFAADLEDFRALFAAGYQDFEQIWLHKPERHACVVEDGEIHGGQE